MSKAGDSPGLTSLIGALINRKLIERDLNNVIRFAALVQLGTVTAAHFYET